MADVHGVLQKDDNGYPVMGGVSSSNPVKVLNSEIDPLTGRLLVDSSGSTGTVTEVDTGAGLTGGPITSTGTISLDSKLAPLDTLGSAGQVPRVNAGATALEYFTPASGSGTVTSVSVAAANGFTGTVANATTTPAITIIAGAITPTSVASTGDITSTGTNFGLTSAGTGNMYVSRAATTNFASQVFRTNGTDEWTVGLRNDSTNNFYIRDNIDGVNILQSTQASTPIITTGGTWTLTTPVINGTSTGTGVSATPTASIIPLFDANKNLSANNHLQGYTTTATAAGTTTLTVGSTQDQYFTGSTTQTVLMPVASTLVLGQQFRIVNNSTGVITIQSSGANTITTLAANNTPSAQVVIMTCILTSGTSAASWHADVTNVRASAGKAGWFQNTLDLAGTDGTTMTFPGTSDTVVTLTATQTLTNKTLTTPVINGTITGTGQATAATASTIVMRDTSANISVNNTLNGYTTTVTSATPVVLTVGSTYQQWFTGSTAQTVTLPVVSTLALGTDFYIVNISSAALTVQSSGGNTVFILASGGTAIFTSIATSGTTAGVWSPNTFVVGASSGKIANFNNSLTLAGTDATTMTFPSTSATVGGLGIAQTWTAQNKFNNIIDVNNAVTVTSNAGTVPVTFRVNTFTNSSAATMAITMATASAVDGQMTIVRIYDFSAVAQTIGWTNTENSTVSAPLASNGSTTLPLTVGFMYNGATSKWRCIASA